MSATTTTSARTTPAHSRVGVRTVTHGEWIKFWSIRSTSITVVAAAIVTIIFAMIFSATVGSEDPAGPNFAVTNPIDVALGAVNLAQLMIGVLGVIVVAGEYSTGLIRTTFAAVGRRTNVIAAKASVLAASTFALMAVGVGGALWAGQAVYAGNEATVSLTDPDLVQVGFGTTVYLTGIGLIGLALGFILRSSSAAIASLFGGVFIGPGLLSLLPDSFTDTFLKYLPSEAGSAMMSRVSNPELLSTGSGYLVFVGWVVALLGLAALLVNTRDA